MAPRIPGELSLLLPECETTLLTAVAALAGVSVLDPPFGLSLGGWNACRKLTPRQL